MVSRRDSNIQRKKRHARVRSKISGTALRPRLCVYRSNANISAQIIDDVAGVTLVSASSYEKEFGSEGGNKEAARMMGIDVDKITMRAYLFSGVIASISGVLLASSSGSATLSAGNVYETYAIAMCAIGGIKLSGGQGSFGGTFFGVMIYFVINTVFTYLNGISVNWQSVIMGVLVLVSVGLQSEVFQNLKIKTKK